ncbi:MAG: IPExxxVDY family protein [Bacteroidales bacterium]|nr:IPExxxVDY family protein [Bacteroidales bacterium]
MAKKINIRLDFSEDNFFTGISCHKREYWVAYNLNHHLKLNLERIKDLPVFNEKSEEILNFPIYHFEDSNSLVTYYLVSNSVTEGKLFPTFKTLDYFLLVSGHFSPVLGSGLIGEIKKIPKILAAYEIKISDNKFIGGFLTDLEIHMIELLKYSKNINPPH